MVHYKDFYKWQGLFNAESPVKSTKSSVYIQFPKEMINSTNIYETYSFLGTELSIVPNTKTWKT